VTFEEQGLPSDLALLINMPNAVERRAFQERQLMALAIPFRLFPATTVADVPGPEMERLRASWARPLRPAEVACTLSHRRAWAEVVASGRPRLILEDDVILSHSVGILLRALLPRSDLDYVTLETYALPKLLSAHSEPVAGTPFRLSRLYRDRGGAAAYLLWPKAAARLLAATERQTPLADAAIDLAAGFRHHQIEPAAAVQAMFLGMAEPAFQGISPSHISASPVPDYSGPLAWLRHKGRRLAISLRLFLRQSAALGAERRRVPHPSDLYRPMSRPPQDPS